MKKDDRIYLLHVREAIGRIQEYSAGGREFFMGSRMAQDAVIRNIEIIGEAVKNVSPALKARHPDIPWKRVAGMRDKLIHEYFGVNIRLVWDVVEKETPELLKNIEKILEELSGPQLF